MVVGNSAGFALGSLKSHPPTMSLTHCTTEREAKYSKLGHICLHTKVPTLLYDAALGALSFHVAISGNVAKIQLAKAHNRGLGIH